MTTSLVVPIVSGSRFPRLWVALAVATLGFPPGVLDAQEPALTVERIASFPRLLGTAPSDPVWSPGGEELAFLWNDQAMPFRDVWVVDASGGAPRRLTDLATTHPAPDREERDPLRALAQQAQARARGGVSEVLWMPEGERLLFLYLGELFSVRSDGSALERLTRSGGGKSQPTYSPDGRFLAFLQNHDLWLWHLRTDHVVQATDVGEPTIGTVPGGAFYDPDVEVASYRWSPDGRFIALQYVDRRGVRKVPFPYYLGEETSLNVLRRPYPGDADEIRRIGIYSVEEGLVRFVELEDENSRGIVAYSWSPDGSSLLIDRDSDVAVDRWLLLVTPEGRKVRELYHDRGERRIYPFFTSLWRSDGKAVLFVGDMDERLRLYALPLEGGPPRRLTGGDWDVVGSRGRASLSVSSGGEIFFVSTQKSPYERQVYRMPETGGAVIQVTSLLGVHEPVVSPDGSKVAVLHSNDVTPTELYIVDARGGEAERRVTHSPPKEFAAHPWIEPRYVTFKSRIDGFTLHGRIIEPPGLDRSQKYPVVLGPVYSNTVRREWRGPNHTLQQFMALEGQYINLQVDIRGSVGYGKTFREIFQGDWGGGDLEDLHSAVEYLKTLPYVDPERIGIWGSSYGGTLAVFSVFEKPGLYAAAVAGAPAIDVAHFTGYDQHLSRRPNTHPEIFDKASALNYGEKLQDPLLIIHGMQDDIVPFRTSVMLAEKLMLLGKDFDFAFAPASAHGWSQREHYAVYLLRKLVQYFDRHMGPGPKPK